MLLAFFERYKTNNEKRDQGANTDNNQNDDYADRPFNGSFVHVWSQMNTNRTRITSLSNAGQYVVAKRIAARL